MTEKQNIENWMSMNSITEYLDVSRETVLQWINIKNMPAHKVGRLWKFKASEVDEWIHSGGAAELSWRPSRMMLLLKMAERKVLRNDRQPEEIIEHPPGDVPVRPVRP